MNRTLSARQQENVKNSFYLSPFFVLLRNGNVMTVANKNIVDAYTGLFKGLDAVTKTKIIENLSKSLTRSERTDSDIEFFKAFGAFESNMSAEEIISDIKSSRTFRKKDIKF